MRTSPGCNVLQHGFTPAKWCCPIWHWKSKAACHPCDQLELAKWHRCTCDEQSDPGRERETSGSWTDGNLSKDVAALVSPECHDLLDRIFSPNPNQRISMADVLHHPWCQQVLSPKYHAAMDAMASQQAQLKRDVGLHTADTVRKSISWLKIISQ